MKRSHAVKILKNSFINHMECGPTCCSSDEEMYSRILAGVDSETGND